MKQLNLFSKKEIHRSPIFDGETVECVVIENQGGHMKAEGKEVMIGIVKKTAKRIIFDDAPKAIKETKSALGIFKSATQAGINAARKEVMDKITD